MKSTEKLLAGILAAGTLSVALPTQAALSYNANVTPTIIFGSGNGNGSFTVAQENGVELGLRAKIRYQGIYNSAGNGTYTFLPTDNWTVEWSINSDYLGSPATRNLTALTYKLTGQFFNFPGVSLDPVNGLPLADHGIGNNSTANGAGDDDIGRTAASYASLIAGNNVAQNSWTPGSPVETLVGLGTYIYTLEAFSGTELLASTYINVEVVPEPSTYIAGALLLLPFGVSTLRKLRNKRTA